MQFWSAFTDINLDFNMSRERDGDDMTCLGQFIRQAYHSGLVYLSCNDR